MREYYTLIRLSCEITINSCTKATLNTDIYTTKTKIAPST